MKNNSLQQFFTVLNEALATMQTYDVQQAQAGLVKNVKDGVLQIENSGGIRMGELVRIEEAGVDALVVQIGKDTSMAVALQPSDKVLTGQAVVSTGRTLGIGVSDQVLGRTINPLGQPLDEGLEIKAEKIMGLEAQAPDVMSRQSVYQPLQTGIVAIDALIPIGRGQRELIIGDRQTGKTTIALDTILNQKGQDVICVYVSIGQRDAKTTQVIQTLKQGGALPYTVVVSASAADPAILQFLAPYAGCAVAEYFMQQGKDVLVVYDDLSKHAVAYREVSLLLRKPPGREAYPGDVFYIHSRLLERSAKLSKEFGGGSLTALPIIETQAGDVSAYVPTNVISITDGQIFLEPSLFYRGIRPAVNVGISVSRVGSAAQTKIMKKIAGTAKLDLAQYYELAAFSQFASELDADSKKQLTRGERLVESLKQKPNRPKMLWQEIVILWTAMKGYLDGVPLSEAGGKLETMVRTMEAGKPELVKAIEERRELTDEIAKSLDESVQEFLNVK